MIKGFLEGKNSKVFVFGLTHADLKRLLDGETYSCEGQAMGIEGRVIFFSRETNDDVAKAIRGVLPAGTPVVEADEQPDGTIKMRGVS